MAYYSGEACEHENHLSAKKCLKCKAEFISMNDDGLYSMRTKAQALAMKKELDTFTYPVDQVMFEHYQKDITPIIKMLFYFESQLLHIEYICLEHSGSAKGLAIAKIQSLMKNKKDWYQIGKFEGGHSVKNILFLLENYYDQYYNDVKSITLTKDGKFNKLISWGF